jgi:glycosyltransferase involved in cell wall biosynthesis
MSILEAMASSLPVIATRVGGIPDLISEGQEGYLLDPGDVNGLARAISQLAQDSDKRRTMGRMGLVKAQSLYDVSVAMQLLQGLYDEILKADHSFPEDMNTLKEITNH